MTLKNNLELPEPFKSMPYSEGLSAFIECFLKKYEENINNENLYKENINNIPTKETIETLYVWQNRFFSPKQKQSIEENYKDCLHCYLKNRPTDEHLKSRYLNHDKSGGIIWNIFYLHILSKNNHLNENIKCEYPIFSQHVYRSMCFMQKEPLKELTPQNDKNKIFEYIRYKKLHAHLKKILGDTDRKIDKALFAFGKSIKEKSKKH